MRIYTREWSVLNIPFIHLFPTSDRGRRPTKRRPHYDLKGILVVVEEYLNSLYSYKKAFHLLRRKPRLTEIREAEPSL